MIYSPSSFSKPVWVSFFRWTQKIFTWICITKELLVAIDVHSMGKNTIEVNGYQQLFGSAEESNSYRFETTWVSQINLLVINPFNGNKSVLLVASSSFQTVICGDVVKYKPQSKAWSPEVKTSTCNALHSSKQNRYTQENMTHLW